MKLNKFTFGIMLGTIIGLLTAPAKGSVTREKLSETAGYWKFKINELLGMSQSDLDELQATLEDRTTEITEDMRQRLISVVKKTKRNYEEMRRETLS